VSSPFGPKKTGHIEELNFHGEFDFTTIIFLSNSRSSTDFSSRILSTASIFASFRLSISLLYSPTSKKVLASDRDSWSLRRPSESTHHGSTCCRRRVCASRLRSRPNGGLRFGDGTAHRDSWFSSVSRFPQILLGTPVIYSTSKHHNSPRHELPCPPHEHAQRVGSIQGD
jgi:hypothetical protein